MDKKVDEKEDRLGKLYGRTEHEYSIYKASRRREVSHFSDHYDIDIALDPNSESSMVKRGLMEGVLAEAKAVAAARGIALLVTIQPSVIDMTRENALLNYEDLAVLSGTYRRTNLTDAVARICSKNRIDYVNLFDLFLHNDPDGLFFRAKDNHWTDRGQDLAAREVASFIADRLLPDTRVRDRTP